MMTGSTDRDNRDEIPQRVVRLEAVERRFGAVTALDGVDLEVSRREVIGLLGHNGAGKTTAVRVLAGLLAADAGRVEVLGMDPVAQGDEVRRRIGVLPARPVVDERLTAAANLRFAAEVFGLPRHGLDDRIDAALRRFELEERRDDRVAGFSTGMRQRLSLARVLLSEPEVLLLDEPTAALDPVAARSVRRMLAGLAREEERTVLLCTHDLGEAEMLCDRVVVLEHGRVVATGSPSELAAEHGVGGVLVEVESSQVPVALEVLGEVTAEDPQVEGAGRIRAVGVARSAVPGLVTSLTKADVTVYEVRRLDPTLEDVYLRLHHRDRDGAPREGRSR